MCRQTFRTAIGAPFRLRDLRWCASTDPVEDVIWVKPPSSDREALRTQQPAPVRTPNSFFVAADEPRHLAGGQQTIGQALRMSRAVASQVIVDPNEFRIRVQIPHGLLRRSTPIGIRRQRARRRPANWGAAPGW